MPAMDLYPGVTLHHLPGHTLGLQAVRVQTERGAVVLASDAIHFWANLEREIPFPIVADVAAYLEALRKLRRLAPSIDHIIPGHDPEVLQRFPAEPDPKDIVRLDLAPAAARSLMSECGFIGLGRMGGAMARRLIDAGHHVIVYDPSAAARSHWPRRAQTLPDARAVADAAPIVFLSLPNPQIVVDVVLGAQGLAEGACLQVCVDLSTSGPDDGREARGGTARAPDCRRSKRRSPAASRARAKARCR